MDISFVIRLVDEFSGRAKGIRENLKGMGSAARDGFSSAIKEGFSIENIETASKNAEAALLQARSRMIGAIGQAITLAAPVIKAGNFQEAFIDFANVAEIPVDKMQEVEAALVAATRTTGKNKSELLEILSGYVGKGMDLNQAMDAIAATGRAATATKATVGDMGNAGFAVMDNLKVDAGDLARAFDVMAASGKESSFELKDMARNFPELTANAASLKMKGVPAVASLAAALQIAMKSAGSADQAANNMSNFLGKISSPETVRNFKKMGIDIEKEMKSAAAKGTDPLMHALQVIKKATGGDEYKMGELFADKQVLDFLRALIPNLEEYERIRDKAGKAEGVIDKDFVNVTAGLNAQFKALLTEIDNLFSAGGVLLPIVQDILVRIKQMVMAVNDWTRANPALTNTIVKAVAGLMSLSVASRVLGYAIAALRLPMIGLASTFLKFENGKNIATGWRVIAGSWTAAGAAARGLGSALLFILRPLKNATAGIAMLSIAGGGGLGGAMFTVLTVLRTVAAGLAGVVSAISAPIATIIALFAAAGFAVWKYWDRISAFASGFAGPIAGLISDAANAHSAFVRKIISGFADLIGVDLSFLDGWKATISNALDFSGFVDSAREKLSSLWSVVSGFFSREKLSDEAKGNVRAAGEALAKALIDGFKAALSGIGAAVASIPGKIREAIGDVDFGFNLFGGQNGAVPPVNGQPPYQPPSATGGAEKEARIIIDDKRPPVATVNLTQNITTSDAVAAGRAASSSAASALAGALHDGGGQ